MIVFLEYLFYNGDMITSIKPKTGTINAFYSRIRQWQYAPLQGCSAKSVPESLILLVGPRGVNTTMLNVIARLGERAASVAQAAETANSSSTPLWPAVRVLDGGNRFNAYIVARAARGRPEVLSRITISRAFTCYQVRSLLESTPAIPVPFVVLDLLNTFYDESVQIGERKRILRACIMHMERLVGAAGGVSTTRVVETADPQGSSANGGWKLPLLAVTVHPPKVPSPEAVELLEMLQGPKVDSYFFQTPAPAIEPMRLF